MAGDWIKMRTSLMTNPRVDGIARDLESSAAVARRLLVQNDGVMSEFVTRNVMRYITVSCLHMIWSAANEHTRDGVFYNADLSYIDEIAGVPGIAAAMQRVEWLSHDPEANTVTLENFCEHNKPGAGRIAGAKTNAQRQADYRARKKAAVQEAAALLTQRAPVSPAPSPAALLVPASAPSPELAGPPKPAPRAPKSNVTRDVTGNGREEKKREEKENKHTGKSRAVARAGDAVCVGFDDVPPKVGEETAYRARQVSERLGLPDIGVKVLPGDGVLQTMLLHGVTLDDFVTAGLLMQKVTTPIDSPFQYLCGVVRRRAKQAADGLPQATTTAAVQGTGPADPAAWQEVQSVVEAHGVRLGAGKWDELTQWPTYRAKVRAAYLQERAALEEGGDGSSTLMTDAREGDA